jgi:hypothetical protein
MTPAQQRQFREAHAQRKIRQMSARPTLPYLDERSDLHVTAAMAAQIHEVANAGTSALDLLDRLEAIIGADRWPEIWRSVQSRPAEHPAILGMRILIDEEGGRRGVSDELQPARDEFTRAPVDLTRWELWKLIRLLEVEVERRRGITNGPEARAFQRETSTHAIEEWEDLLRRLEQENVDRFEGGHLAQRRAGVALRSLERSDRQE